MSIPSITIRLDFGDGSSAGVAGGMSLQGNVPTPVDFGSSWAGAAQVNLPTPFTSSAAMAAQDVAPTPMSGIGGMSVAMNSAPEPSLDIARAGFTGMADVMPHPEGEPEAAKKPTGKR